MFGSALYYPYIEVRDQNWLRSALLFWDRIQTIVPTSISKPYHSPDTLICQDEGFLQPLHCDLHQDVLKELGRRVIEHLTGSRLSERVLQIGEFEDPSVDAILMSEGLGQQISHQFHLEGIYPEKLSPELKEHLVQVGLGQVSPSRISSKLSRSIGQADRLHPDKLSEELKHLFGYRAEYDGEWFLVDGRFAATYMAALAAMLAKATGLSPLTTDQKYQGFNLNFLLKDFIGEPVAEAKGTLLTLVLEGLQVDPETPIKKLIKFRRARSMQLAELSAKFDDLKSKIDGGDAAELEEQARRTVENEIRPGLEKLKKELADQTILSAWTSFYQAATFSAGGGSALVKFADTSPGIALGLGAFLTATNVAINSVTSYRKTRASSPYTYLMDVNRKFSLPVWAK